MWNVESINLFIVNEAYEKEKLEIKWILSNVGDEMHDNSIIL